ncbi:MAG: hypothetical protein NW201_05110 [Gemmatimonadales bacterium]|nr:hypothetical protein [Gemmatimonadales bacterium]
MRPLLLWLLLAAQRPDSAQLPRDLGAADPLKGTGAPTPWARCVMLGFCPAEPPPAWPSGLGFVATGAAGVWWWRRRARFRADERTGGRAD